MKTLLLFFILIFSCSGFSQEDWDYLPIEIPDNYHGAICPINENVVHVVSDYGKFYKTVDGGENWSQFDTGINEYFFDLSFDGIDNGYAVGDNGKILKTTNAGQTWYELSSGTSEALISVAINATNSIWAVGTNGKVLHSTNGGTTWVIESSLTVEKLNSIQFKNEDIGYIAGDNGTLFYTENAGVDWVQLTIPSTDDLFSISITENFLYLASGFSYLDPQINFGAYELYRTNNNTDWLSHSLYFEGPGCSDLFFYSDDSGFTIDSAALLCDCCFVWIKKTIDGGETWEFSLDEETNAANCHANTGYADIKFVTAEIGYILLGPRILKTPYEFVGVEEFDKANAFSIYPNPITNGNFSLKINSTNTQDLLLNIFDVAGNKIYTKNNLKEDNIISVPNISKGIYFVKLLKNGKMVASRKLINGH